MRNKEQSLCLLVVTIIFIHQSQATDESPEGVDESWQRDNHHDDHDHESNQTGNEIPLHTICNRLISYLYIVGYQISFEFYF